MEGGLLVVPPTEVVLLIVGGSIFFIAAILVLTLISSDVGNVIYSITQMSLRQAATPDNFQRRVSSIFATLVRFGWPSGELLSGFLAEQLGLRITLFIGTAGAASAAFRVIYGNLWELSSLDTDTEIHWE
jgi:predicted MFS family arabinose efflux permease